MKHVGKQLIRVALAAALTLSLGAAPAFAMAPGGLIGGSAGAATCSQASHWYDFAFGRLRGKACTEVGTAGTGTAPAAAASGLNSLLLQKLLVLLGRSAPQAAPAAATRPAQPLCGPPLIHPRHGKRQPPETEPEQPPETEPEQPPETEPEQPPETEPEQPPQTQPPQTQPPAPQPQPGVPAPPATGGLSAAEQQMLNLVNDARQKAGLAPLTVDPGLEKVARLKAQDMVDNNYFDHNSPTYGSPFDMMRRFGVSYRTAGENIAGDSSVQDAFQSLMNSPGHRANILSPEYSRIGIGVVRGGPYGMMFTQEFAG